MQPVKSTAPGNWAVYKLTKTGWNSHFFPFPTGCQTNTKKPYLPCYLPITEGELINLSLSFEQWNENELVQDLKLDCKFYL